MMSKRSSDSKTHSRDSSPPTMLEVLGEHLYVKVEELQPNYDEELDVAKITGVLLELGEEKVLQLLQNKDALLESIDRVLLHVPEAVTVCVDEDGTEVEDKNATSTEPCSPEVEEHLYDRVHQLEPAYSSQITGMLLEMGASQVQTLLKSHSKLQMAVSKAKVAYVTYHHSPQHGHNSPQQGHNSPQPYLQQQSPRSSHVSPPHGLSPSSPISLTRLPRYPSQFSKGFSPSLS